VIEQHEYDLASRMRDTVVATGWLIAGWFVRAMFVVPLFVSAALGGFVAAMRARLRKTGIALLGLFLCLLPLQQDQNDVWMQFPFHDGSAASVTQWLEEHAPPGEIYTNHQLLAPYMVRQGHPLASRTKFMLAADHQFELVHLSNPANGQRAAVLDAIPKAVFGAVVYPEELDPARVRPGTWFVLINDVRTDQILPPERWKSRWKSITETDGIRVYELLP
jgi:hypothetical protein